MEYDTRPSATRTKKGLQQQGDVASVGVARESMYRQEDVSDISFINRFINRDKITAR